MPQFVGLVIRSAHAAPQREPPPAHKHAPAAQVPVAPHELPHEPQLLMSVDALTHVPLHASPGGGH